LADFTGASAATYEVASLHGFEMYLTNSGEMKTLLLITVKTTFCCFNCDAEATGQEKP